MIGGALAVLAILPLLASCYGSESAVANKTILKINSRQISAKEFSERLALRLKDFDALYAKDEANLQRAKEQTIQTFTLEAIAQDFARVNNIAVDNKEIDAETKRIRAQYPDDMAFRRSLAQANTPYERWRQDVQFTLLQKKIFAAITANSREPTEAELRTFYDENKALWTQGARVRLRQIVLAKEDDAKRILEQLEAGKDMARLAKEFSVAPEADNGGDTGWIAKGTLEVFDQAFKMNLGTRSKIIKSPYGFHIFEVLKKEPEGHLSFGEAKAKIRSRLKSARSSKFFRLGSNSRPEKTVVVRNDALIQAIQIATRGN